MAIARTRWSNSGVTRVANWTMRLVRRIERPSIRPSSACSDDRDGDAGISPALSGGSIARASGRSRFVLASAGEGGAPSVRRRLRFEKSAIPRDPVDKRLDQRVGALVQL